MAVARVRNETTGMDEELPGLGFDSPDVSMPDMGMVTPQQDTMGGGGQDVLAGINTAQIPGGDPLGSRQSPAERAVMPTTFNTLSSIIGNAPPSLATPTMPTQPTPIAQQTPNPTMVQTPGQSPSVARQPLVGSGSGGGSLVGRSEGLLGGGFSGMGQRQPSPKGILQTLFKMLGVALIVFVSRL